MKGPETRLRLKIQAALKTLYPKAVIYKIHGGPMQNVGIPDLLCCVYGQFVALEIKTPRGKLTKVQKIELDRIKEAGGFSAEVRSVQEAISIMSLLKEKK